ncbi:hypothetical protein B0H10DRAFT_1947413 [Mycena sp. CBHHK59/15]|nr:hypothetical protein B0H10DRAFT_1947413 [Mycena sp. CBHHK59/15]
MLRTLAIIEPGHLLRQQLLKQTSYDASASFTAVPAQSKYGGAAGFFTAVKPANWPNSTWQGPAPTSTVATSSDPYLKELSEAPNNSGVHAFTAIHTGDMTWYEQGLTAVAVASSLPGDRNIGSVVRGMGCTDEAEARWMVPGKS